MRADPDTTLHPFELNSSRLRFPPAPLRYAFAVECVFIAFVVRYSLTQQIGNEAPFAFFVPAVLIAAWYGGSGPGALAVVAGLVLGYWFFLPPHGTSSLLDANEALLVAIYLLATVTGIVLLGALHRAHRREFAALKRAHLHTEQMEGEIQDRKQMEEILMKEKGFFDALLDSLPGIFYLLDEQGRFKRWNENFERVSQYSAKEIGLMHFPDFFPDEARPEIEQRIREVFMDGQSSAEAELVTRDGSKIFYFLSGRRVAHGQSVCLAGMGIDISERKRAEEAARRAKERTATILESMTDSFFALDYAWRFTYLNHGAETFFGKPSEQLIGKTYWESFPVTIGTEFDKQYHKAMAQQKAVHFEAPSVVASSAWIEVHAYPSQEGLGIFFRDATKRKQSADALKASEQRLRVAVKNSPVTVFTQDSELRYTWIYNAGSGHMAGEVLGKSDADLFPGPDLERLASVKRQVLETGGGTREEVKVVTAPGREWYYDLTIEPLKDSAGEVVGITCAAIDVSERKHAELALHKAKELLAQVNLDLERRVTERTAQLEETIQSLQGFCYSIAHDLRSPLRALRGFTTALVEDYGSKLDKVGNDYAQRIGAAAVRMDRLIEDLLSYGQLSHMELRCSSLDPSGLLDQALAQLTDEIRNKRAVIEVQRPLPRLQAHPVVLNQILTNLLTNALKFVRPGDAPWVRICAEEKEKTVRLWIQDNGIGIDPAHRERIFRVFERLHGNDKYPGTGIGLALVRKGAERMGGKVGVESELTKGSSFWIELPR